MTIENHQFRCFNIIPQEPALKILSPRKKRSGALLHMKRSKNNIYLDTVVISKGQRQHIETWYSLIHTYKHSGFSVVFYRALSSSLNRLLTWQHTMVHTMTWHLHQDPVLWHCVGWCIPVCRPEWDYMLSNCVSLWYLVNFNCFMCI